MYDTENLCPRCFSALGAKGLCPHCGKKTFEPLPCDPSRLALGSRLKNRYILSYAIGEGGFGITYLAYDTMNGIKVAVKEYFPVSVVVRGERGTVMPAKPEYRQRFMLGKKRFMDEAKNMAAIKNLRGVPAVLDFFSENDTAYIVMEYLSGKTLKDLIKKKKRLSYAAALEILRPVFSSLALIHDAGLVHRDVSPDNIILTDGGAKLIDFGATVKAGKDKQSTELKRHYAPPEQYDKNFSADSRADVYAAGVTMYNCITGLLPPESIKRAPHDKPMFRGKLTDAQKSAVSKAMETEISDRYPDMRRMLAAFDAAL